MRKHFNASSLLSPTRSKIPSRQSRSTEKAQVQTERDSCPLMLTHGTELANPLRRNWKGYHSYKEDNTQRKSEKIFQHCNTSVLCITNVKYKYDMSYKIFDIFFMCSYFSVFFLFGFFPLFGKLTKISFILEAFMSFCCFYWIFLNYLEVWKANKQNREELSNLLKPPKIFAYVIVLQSFRKLFEKIYFQNYF